MGVSFRRIDDYKYFYECGMGHRFFRRFRERLAADIGAVCVCVASGCIETQDIDDPLAILLNHSGYDGEIGPDDCASIAPRLREVVSKWPDDDDMHWMRRCGLALADAMEDCAQAQRPLEFC